MQCIQYCDHYDALSDRASERLIQVIQDKPDATICLATGATPELTYRFFVEKIQKNQVDIRNVTFVKLDEWVGIPLHTPGMPQQGPAQDERNAPHLRIPWRKLLECG